MSYELTQLEELIKQLRPENDLNPSQKEHLTGEIQRLALAIPANCFALPDATRTAAYIQWHQEGLVDILNQLDELQGIDANEIITGALYILQQLEKLFAKEMISEVLIPNILFKQEIVHFQHLANRIP